ncbi:MAG TPA: hypothetical protein VND64_31565 [Pirellulales bacterium]|nr:hypothetical protein [Pirellulales bacterium]
MNPSTHDVAPRRRRWYRLHGSTWLVAMHGLKKLMILDLRGTRVTVEGVNDLQRALPSCRILR